MTQPNAGDSASQPDEGFGTSTIAFVPYGFATSTGLFCSPPTNLPSRPAARRPSWFRRHVLSNKLGLVLLILMLVYAFKPDSGKPSGVPTWRGVHPNSEFKLSAPLNPTGAAAKPAVVIRFNGDMMATQGDRIARAVDEILVNRAVVDRVILLIESPGGESSSYARVAAEIERLRNARDPHNPSDKGVNVVVCIDKIAASGGYWVASTGNKIFAAPGATVGSIGTVREFLNFSVPLKWLGIKPITQTAGTWKRTLTPFSDVTQQSLDHDQSKILEANRLFVAWVKKYRPGIDTDKVCNGDHWSAQESVDQKLGLVDGVMTSSEYLLRVRKDHPVIEIGESTRPPGFLGGLSELQKQGINQVMDRFEQYVTNLVRVSE